MAEYIEREKVIKMAEINKAVCQCLADIVDVRDIVNCVPAADVAPVVHGHWIKDFHLSVQYECSECHNCIGEEPHYDYINDVMRYPKYCEHCGAKMDRKQK